MYLHVRRCNHACYCPYYQQAVSQMLQQFYNHHHRFPDCQQAVTEIRQQFYSHHFPDYQQALIEVRHQFYSHCLSAHKLQLDDTGQLGFLLKRCCCHTHADNQVYMLKYRISLVNCLRHMLKYLHLLQAFVRFLKHKFISLIV